MRATIYLHADRASNYDKGEKLGLKGEALTSFSYACYEVKIEGDVDEKTGDFTITHVDGKELQK